MPEPCVICFAAHPDDETIGAGGQLWLIPNIWIAHATDGAPRNLLDAHAHGFSTREDYARVRREELMGALDLAGIGPERALSMEFVDQECALNLVALIDKVEAVLRD